MRSVCFDWKHYIKIVSVFFNVGCINKRVVIAYSRSMLPLSHSEVGPIVGGTHPSVRGRDNTIIFLKKKKKGKLFLFNRKSMAYFKRLFSCKYFLEIDSFSQQAKNGEVRKSGRIENILISLIFVWLRVKKWRDRKSELV